LEVSVVLIKVFGFVARIWHTQEVYSDLTSD